MLGSSATDLGFDHYHHLAFEPRQLQLDKTYNLSTMTAFNEPIGSSIGTIHIGTDMKSPSSDIPTSPALPSWAILAPSRTCCWKGLSSIRYLFIFGASYSSTCIPASMGRLEPRDDEPLGIPFPGICSTEPGTPNWVGHLITEYAPSPHQILVYNYAMLGSTAPDVTLQIDRYFLGDNGPTARKVPWTAENSLFITWVGLNDLAISPDPDEPIKELFRGQERLYAAGARNFLFINVPPIERSPACTLLEMYDVVDDDREASIIRAASRFFNWNLALAAAARRFASPGSVPLTPSYSPELISDRNVRPPVAVAESQKHVGASIMLFSSYECMSMILDNPTSFGLAEADLQKIGGSIWVDYMHPTSVVHDLLARDISRFLNKI